MTFEELKQQMYDLFTVTLERVQLLYVNPGKLSLHCDTQFASLVALADFIRGKERH